jgi:hypothetical protein
MSGADEEAAVGGHGRSTKGRLRNSKRGPYSAVVKDDDGDDFQDEEEDDHDLIPAGPEPPIPKWVDLLHRNWIPEEAHGVRNVDILDSVEALRLLKFTVLTALAMVFMFHWARFMDWEHDGSYSMQDMLLFDAGNMMLDIIVFFFLGRLYKQKGVDHLAWTLVTLMASIYTSWSYTFTFLQHSVSLYDMHCNWPLSLWFYLTAVLAIAAVLIVKHVQHAIQHEKLVVKLVELTLAACIWLLPQMSHPNFHFHHWFAGWLVGMHFNVDTWWSRAAMAWCWGQYINGLSTWGRDPQLTCAYAYYMSVDQYCPYMQCFQEQIAVLQPDTNTTVNQTVYMALPEPDWMNCSADGNYNP